MNLIDKDDLLSKIYKRRRENFISGGSPHSEYYYEDDQIISIINTLEVKEVDRIPARIEVNKHHNRFISSWSGLCQYDNFRIGEEVTILLPKNKAQKGKRV